MLKSFGKHVWSNEGRIKAMKNRWLKWRKLQAILTALFMNISKTELFISVQQRTAEFHKMKKIKKKKNLMVLGIAHNFTPALSLYHFKPL